jgi:hypothetical protein
VVQARLIGARSRDSMLGNRILLTESRPTHMLDGVKTITTREFFHSPGLTKALRPGQSFLVTDNGKPSFTVTKAGQRPRRTREDLEREARELCPEGEPKVNFTAALRELKKR